MFRKHSDEIPELTLSKWPFILGDLLLVGIALAIAILGDWQLTDWQVVACVLAVALGAALFVLPFIVEYFARQQENSSVTDQRSIILANHVKELEARCAVMADQITRLNQAQEAALKESIPNGLDAAALKPIEERLDQQAKQLKATEQSLEKVRTAQAAAVSASSKKEPASKPEVKPVAKTEAKPKAKSEPRPSRKADGQLLKRAIHEKQDQAAQAVDRIIESKPSEQKKEIPQSVLKETQPKPSKKPDAPKAEEPEPAVEAAQPESTEPSKPEPKPKPEPEPKAEEKVTPAVSEAAQPKPDTEDKPEPEAAPTLFEADESTATPIKAKAKKHETVCIVNSLIGIGNKPYLRGSGGGLNWDNGLVMEFEAIGKWRWATPEDLKEPIEVQVYRNDEDPDTSGKHTLRPGKALEINAKF